MVMRDDQQRQSVAQPEQFKLGSERPTGGVAGR